MAIPRRTGKRFGETELPSFSLRGCSEKNGISTSGLEAI